MSRSASLGAIWTSAEVSSTVAAVRQVLASPSANPRLSILVLAIAVLFVLMLLVLGLALATPSRRRIVKVRRHYGQMPEDARDPAPPAEDGTPSAAGLRLVTRTPEATPRPPGRVFLAATSPATLAVLALLTLAAAYAGTSSNAYCGSTCHAGSVATVSARESGHAACVACHEDGYLAFVSNTASRTRMAWRYALGGKADRKDAVVDSASCRGCHSQQERRTVTSAEGLRMSHVEVVRGGVPCTSCHPDAGHISPNATRATVTADACLPCHDSRTASAECGTCHSATVQAARFSSDETGTPLGSGRWEYPAVRAANSDCGACHDQEKQCDGCHGIRLPHSRAFEEGAHAVAAAFERKLSCFKCHEAQSCSNGPCHSAPFSPVEGSTTHGAAWKQEHKGAPRDAGCVCHQNRTARTKPICTRCHAEDDWSLLPIAQ